MGAVLKFQSIAAFEKHLHEAFPDHLSHVYMVISPFDFERKKMIEMITSLRSFQSGQQAIQAIGQTLQAASTQVGSINGS